MSDYRDKKAHQCDRCGSVVPPERHQYDCPNAPAPVTKKEDRR